MVVGLLEAGALPCVLRAHYDPASIRIGSPAALTVDFTGGPVIRIGDELLELTHRDFGRPEVEALRDFHFVLQLGCLATRLVLGRAHQELARGDIHEPHAEAVFDLLHLGPPLPRRHRFLVRPKPAFCFASLAFG